MKSSSWLQGSYSQQLIDWCQRCGEEAAEVRHELFYLAAGRTRLSAGLRAFAALLRDTSLLMRNGPCLEKGVKPKAILLATLPGANGWGTLERSLPVLLQAGFEPLVLAHPRLGSRAFASGLQTLRPARVDVATLLAALRVFASGLLRSHPLLLASCLARQRLWQGSLKRTLADSRGVLVLHNDFDMMSRAAIGHGMPAICLQHGIPTDEFFPTRAEWYVTWGSSSTRAFEAGDSHASKLVEDALGRDLMPRYELATPLGISLLSQTHAQVLGEGVGAALKGFAGALLRLEPQARILLHPQEGQPYAGVMAQATRRPPHLELQAGGCSSRLVMGYCSTAMIDAALAGHWVLALQLQLEGNSPARSALAVPLQAETAEQAVVIYRRLQEDADFRHEAGHAQANWLRDSFSHHPGGLADLLEQIYPAGAAECTR